MRYFKGLHVPGKDRRISWALMSTFDIPCDLTETKVYLRRLRIIQTPWFGIYLHETSNPDVDPHLHDHPWTFWSLVLKGGYTEAHYSHGRRTVNVWRRWSIHRMKLGDFHKITHLLRKPTWTLLLTGPRRKEWGFMTDKGWVPWHQYARVATGRKIV